MSEETGHGHDRGAAEATHDSSADATDTGDAGAGAASRAVAVYDPGNAGGAVANPGNGSPLDFLAGAMGANPYSNLNTVTHAQYNALRQSVLVQAQNAMVAQAAMSQQIYGQRWACTISTVGFLGGGFSPSVQRAYTPPPPLEHAGITVGEIIAWRIWLVRPDGFLMSASADSIWVPGEPMQGDVGPDGRGEGGVHAWKSAALALKYGSQHGPAVIGEIALWGDVVEHADGYRAEFGKPHSFKWAMGDGAKGKESVWTKVMRRRTSDVEGAMQTLRDLYGVAA